MNLVDVRHQTAELAHNIRPHRGDRHPVNTDALHPAARIARLDALNASTWPERINRALTQLRHASSPLRAATTDSDGSTSKGGHSDPVADTAINTHPDPNDTRRRLLRAIMRRDELAREIAVILDDWAATPPTETVGPSENADYWCKNHLAHGVRVAATKRGKGGTRGADGNCGWCRSVLEDWDALPTGQLIRLHDRGIRIAEAHYQRELGTIHRRNRTPALLGATTPTPTNPPPPNQTHPPQTDPPSSNCTPLPTGSVDGSTLEAEAS